MADVNSRRIKQIVASIVELIVANGGASVSLFGLAVLEHDNTRVVFDEKTCLMTVAGMRAGEISSLTYLRLNSIDGYEDAIGALRREVFKGEGQEVIDIYKK